MRIKLFIYNFNDFIILNNNNHYTIKIIKNIIFNKYKIKPYKQKIFNKNIELKDDYKIKINNENLLFSLIFD